jgi:hypothetical protein
MFMVWNRHKVEGGLAQKGVHVAHVCTKPPEAKRELVTG